MEGTDDDQPDGQTALHVIHAIEEQTAAGKPWFIGAGFHRPHDPFLSPKKYFDLYPPGSIKIYHDPSDITPTPPMAIAGGAFKTAFDAFTEQDRIDFQRAYYAGVSFTDAQVGRLLDTLDRLKLWDKTVIIFTGDNGYHHNERNWWNKNTLFEVSCRVPLIVAAPGAKAGQVCNGLVELVDYYPTVADYCGVKPPPTWRARAFVPCLKIRRAPASRRRSRSCPAAPENMGSRSEQITGGILAGPMAPRNFMTRQTTRTRLKISPQTGAMRLQFRACGNFSMRLVLFVLQLVNLPPKNRL
jgi:uncharacterized sulfatase